jgi:hypothetical protein
MILPIQSLFSQEQGRTLELRIVWFKLPDRLHAFRLGIRRAVGVSPPVFRNIHLPAAREPVG